MGVELFCLIDTKMCNNGVKVYQIHPINDPGNMLRMVVRHHKVYVIEPGGHFANNDVTANFQCPTLARIFCP